MGLIHNNPSNKQNGPFGAPPPKPWEPSGCWPPFSCSSNAPGTSGTIWDVTQWWAIFVGFIFFAKEDEWDDDLLGIYRTSGWW